MLKGLKMLIKGIAATTKKVSGSVTMAIVIKTAFLASVSIILFANSTFPIAKPIDVLAQADTSVDVASEVYISVDNSYNNDDNGAGAADSIRDNNNKKKENRLV